MSTSTAAEILSTLPAKFDTALASGNLHHFPSTVHHRVEDDIPFQIRLCPSLAKKPTLPAQGTEGVKSDPFAPPYNPHLYVGQLQHEDVEYAVLLNKYSVIPHHFVLVTRDLQFQTSPLLPPDLVQTYQLLLAAQKCGRHFLAFYNCGPHSGASQPHKHIQFIPLDEDEVPPVEGLAKFARLETPDKPFSLSALPYANHVVRLPPNLSSLPPSELEDRLSQGFLSLVDLVISTIRHDPEYPPGKPSYNVIMTLEHMHLIPRRSDTYTVAETGRQIGVNSLGFAGHLLAKSQDELEAVTSEGILNILKGVALSSVHDLQVAGTTLEC